MKIFKNVLLIMPLCAISPAVAKTISKTGQPTRQQPVNRDIQIQQPRQPQPQIITPQQQPVLNEMRYTEILSELKKKHPASEDFTTLKKIKEETEHQMNIIQTKTNQPHIQPISSNNSNINNFALQASVDEIMFRHSIPFQVSDETIRGAWLEKNDLFNEQQVIQQESAVKNIVREVRQKYPTIDKQRAIDAIKRSIEKNQDFKNLKSRIGNMVIKGINNIKPSLLYNEIIERIEEIIEENWQ